MVAHQAQIVAEADQKGAILRLQHGLEERLQVVVMGFEEALLAAAHVHDQSQGQWDVGAAGEEGDLLRHAILGNFEIVLGQVGDQVPLLVAHGEADVDQADLDADGRRRLGADKPAVAASAARHTTSGSFITIPYARTTP